MSQDIKAKILCVEDEQDIRENIAEILRDEGFEVIEAGDGNKGFDAFLKHKPHLIISDIMMPNLNGYGLLKKVREDKTSRNNNVPFIFLTALGQKDDIIKGVDLSANDYLVKPIDFDMLIAKSKEKTQNSIKLLKSQDQKIDNIKNQFSSIIPIQELTSYLDVITQVTSILKEEPYGKLKDERYLEDFDKIHIHATKIRSAITNFIDQSTLENKLNANESVISIIDFFESFIAKLNDKFKSKIIFDKPFDESETPKIKVDKLGFIEGIRKILSKLLKIDFNATVEISITFDSINQMNIIFYLNSSNPQVSVNNSFKYEDIQKILDEQNIAIDILQKRENTIMITIPSFRIT